MDCGQDMPAYVSSPDLEGLLLLLLAWGAGGEVCTGEGERTIWAPHISWLTVLCEWIGSCRSPPVPRVSSYRDVALLFLPSTKQVPGLDLLNKCFWNKRRSWAMFFGSGKIFLEDTYFFLNSVFVSMNFVPEIPY